MYPACRRRLIRALPILLFAACASPAPEAPVTRPVTREDPYVIQPLSGYPLTAADELTAVIDDAYDDLRHGAELPVVEAIARQLLNGNAGFHPAKVLLAQTQYLGRRDSEVIEVLRAVVDELPAYTAAQWLLGGAAERAGDLPIALEAFSHLAEQGDLSAAKRSDTLRPRALQIVFNELESELDRGRVEVAEEHLGWLEHWAAESWELVEGTRRVAIETGDLQRELSAVRLLGQQTGALEHLQREGQLELEVGDVRVGLDKLEALIRDFPDDASTRELLDEAKFLWRLQLLPAEVQETSRKAELDRADVATLLYWLVPEVRRSQVTNPPIAADILDHPTRDVILKVLNLGLMEVDETRHRFEPDAAATQVEVLAALVRLLDSDRRSFSCLPDASVLNVDRSWRSICQLATDCRLVKGDTPCAPTAIAGREALDLFRRTLNMLGSGG